MKYPVVPVVFFAAMCAVFATTSLHAAELRIHVSGLRSAQGDLHYAVYDDAAHFPEGKGWVAEGKVKARTPGVKVVIGGLRPGIYAVAVYHDENGNDEFDQGLLGIPLEDFGFSGDALAFLGPPGFSSAAIEIRAGGTDTEIHLSP